jgi:hypothetical protein
MPPARGWATPLGKSSGALIDFRPVFTCLALAMRPLSTIPGRAASPQGTLLPCIADPPTMQVVQRPFPHRATTTPTPRRVCLVVSETLSGFPLFGDCAFAVTDSAVLFISSKPRNVRVPICNSEDILMRLCFQKESSRSHGAPGEYRSRRREPPCCRLRRSPR